MEESVIANLVARVGVHADSGGLEELMGKLGKLKMLFKAFIVFELIHKLYELGEQFAALGETLERSAIQTGLTTDRLQELQYAATQNAVSADELTGALSRMGRMMFAAQKGSKQAVDAFARLGISPEQIKNFKGLDEALLAVQDGLAGLSSQQEKLAVVQALYGRSGGKFLKFLEIGSAETRTLMKRAQMVGAVIKDTNVKALAEFEDASSSINLVFRDFMANVTGAFIPTLTQLFRAMETGWGNIRGPLMRGIQAAGDELSYQLYVAIKFAKLYGELLRRALFGGEGPGGVVHDALLPIAKFIGWFASQVKEIFDLLVRFFNESELGTQIKGLFVDTLKLAWAWCNRFVSIIKTLFEVLGTEPADDESFFVRFLRVSIQLTSDLIKNIRQVIRWYTRLIGDGGFSEGLTNKLLKGEGTWGGVWDKFKNSFTDDQQSESRGIPPAYQGIMGRRFGLQSMMAFAEPELGSRLNQNLLPRTALPSGYDQAGGGVNSTVNVYTQGNASPEAIAAAVDRKQKLVLPKLFSETRRDLQSPLRW